jgi:6-phosphofructokinase 2
MKRILTLTINPAIDASCAVEAIFPDHKLRCGAVYHEPGGGGVNVSRAIRNLDGKSTVLYLAGGTSGQMLGVLLDREGLKHEAVPIEGWTRENFTVTESTSGQQYRFVMPGPDVTAEEWNTCLERIAGIKPVPEFVVASGSLPPGVPADFYARLAKRVCAKGSRFILDTSGTALSESLRGHVYLVKPSMRELRGLVERELSHESEQDEAAMQIVKSGQAEIVVVSIGAAGVLLATAEGCNRISSPTVPVKSKVGAVMCALWRIRKVGKSANRKVVAACRAANISRNSAYTHYRRFPRFGRKWKRAQEQAWEQLRREAWAAELARPYRQKWMAKMARLGIKFPDWFEL